MRYVFYINPIAGKGIAQKNIIDSIKNYFADKAEDFKIHITTAIGDAKQAAKREAETGDIIRMFACGGEGTVFEVLNGIAGHSNVELGVIPCGSANDFLKFFESRDSFLNIDEQIDGEVISMDLIKAGDNYCLNGCSVGMDAVVARDMSIFKKWPAVSGPLAYNLAIVKTFLGKLGITADISVDGETPECKTCLFAVIANAPYYGGGYKGAPEAVPYDNKLDFTLVDKISKLKILSFLGIYKKGEHKKLDCCTLKNCTSMEFKSEKPIPVNLDGEIIETKSMKFELEKNAVKFVVPKGVVRKLLIKV
ncbi:MAG: YegS/Rv2252/BmrU family lipid kinase [Clostridia bacterium]|nr:YegS/Rv2252/BmrU family lipid kinase [Clostridia bacterium]